MKQARHRPASNGANRSAARVHHRHTSSGVEARRAALQILVRVERDRAFADVLLGQQLDSFAPNDRRFITRLVLGTIAWQGRLDFELSNLSARPLGELAPEILAILRMGLFQVRILTRVPPHAAVDTAVRITHNIASKGAAGFVNAVLRSAIRKPFALPPREDDEINYLAIAYSHPRWLVAKMISWFGLPAAESLMAANNEPAPSAIRLNLVRGKPDELIAQLAGSGMTGSTGRFPETLVLNAAPVLDRQSWGRGLFQMQAEASQLASRMLAPTGQGLVIDCTAAPGGKTTHLAELAGPAARILALDLNHAGLRNVRATAARLGHSNVVMACADSSSSLPVRQRSAGFVLLDAPCTGLGTLREHPEIRWRLGGSDIERMAVLQRRMLNEAAAAVSTGGVLVYSVCSIAPEEGPEAIADFLTNNPDFEIDRSAIGKEFDGLVDHRGYMQTRPDRDALDGFFAARLRRRN